jgi:sodium-coupled neutral amino acid transporter 11
MPLLVGLADAVEVRRNPDLPLHTFSNGQTGRAMVNGRVVLDNEDPAERVDITELAAQQHKGGNMLDSMFNMANSILGAGKHLRERTVSKRLNTPLLVARYHR